MVLSSAIRKFLSTRQVSGECDYLYWIERFHSIVNKCNFLFSIIDMHLSILSNMDLSEPLTQSCKYCPLPREFEFVKH